MSKISDKDKKDWQDFLSKNEKLPNKDNIKSNSLVLKKTEIDLHGFTLEDANKETEKFIHESFNNGFNKVRVVTGKGLHSENDKNPYVSKKLGILKYSIPEYIKNKSDLMEKINNIQDASIDDGGKGAFYIYLKKNL